MSAIPPIRFERMPAVWRLYWRALFTRRADTPCELRPQLRAAAGASVPDPKRLARFRSVIGQSDDELLPPTYPQVLAAPLHLAMFTSATFPFNPGGLVHTANRIEIRRVIEATEALTIEASVADYTSTSRGCEIDLQTDARDAAGQLAWRAHSTVLARTSTAGGRPRRRAAPPSAAATEHVASWRATTDVGRRYARVSGDFNPIHLAAPAARIFGFERAIAHGMWSLARVLAELEPLPAPPLEIDVAFRRPMLLPAQASLFAEPGPGGQFVLRDNKTSKAFLQGTVAQVGRNVT